MSECAFTFKKAVFPACTPEKGEENRRPKRTDDTVTKKLLDDYDTLRTNYISLN